MFVLTQPHKMASFNVEYRQNASKFPARDQVQVNINRHRRTLDDGLTGEILNRLPGSYREGVSRALYDAKLRGEINNLGSPQKYVKVFFEFLPLPTGSIMDGPWIYATDEDLWADLK
jgi:hypothetical protein